MISISFGWPQLVWFALAVFMLIYTTIHHGEAKTGSAAMHNVFHYLISIFLSFALLYWGGFFTPCG
jgi:hypothetical protein